jgi:site-specific recombinase XerD
MADIYNLDRRLECKIESIKESKLICEKNKEDILKFKDDCFSDGLTVARVVKLVKISYYLAVGLGKPLRDATKDDIKELVRKIETDELAKIVKETSGNGKEKWAYWTKYDYKVILKKFFRWLKDEENPTEVSWIKYGRRNNGNILPEDLLTQEDIKKMVKAADNPRDKSLIGVLYGSGIRVGELANLRIRNCLMDHDQYGAILLVKGKTGHRRIRLISSTALLANWLEHHPYKNDPDAPLWVTKFNRINNDGESKFKPLDYAGIRKVLRVVAKRASISKRVNPHSIRKSRASHLANDLTDAQLKEMFGWTKDSKMASVYIHLSGRDVDKALLRAHGIIKEEKKELTLRVIKCKRCKENNSSTSDFCKRCGTPLTLDVALNMEHKRKEKENIFAEIIGEPEIIEILINKIKEKGLEKKFFEL